MNIKQIAIYPGTFDPPTNGHLDIILRASKLFTKVIIAVTNNPNKKSDFTIDERINMLRQITSRLKNVEVDKFEGLLVDYLKSRNVKIIIRGLRAVSDFEYEFQLALMNKKLRNIETIFLVADEKYTYLSSSLIKEIARYRGNLKGLVPQKLRKIILAKYKT